MTTLNIAIELVNNAHNVQDIVELINNETSCTASPEQIAAAYILECTEEYGFSEENAEPHFETLEEAGAEFDCSEALSIARNHSIEMSI